MELSSQNAGAGSVTSQTQSVRISIDDDDDDDASALQQTMQREWNTADFTGKCKNLTTTASIVRHFP